MDTRKSSATRAPVNPKARLARLEEKYRHEPMDPDARLEFRESIVRLRRELGL
jgi:hypothetical protein